MRCRWRSLTGDEPLLPPLALLAGTARRCRSSAEEVPAVRHGRAVTLGRGPTEAGGSAGRGRTS